jgi:hypothetical protein
LIGIRVFISGGGEGGIALEVIGLAPLRALSFNTSIGVSAIRVKLWGSSCMLECVEGEGSSSL